MTLFWVSQAIGLVALAVSFSSYQAKKRRDILFRQIIGSVVYVLHFGLLSAWTGLAMNAVVVLRNVVFLKKGDSYWASHQAWMWFFMALSVGVLFFTWEGPVSLLPTAGVLLGVYARWHEDEKRIRLFALLGVLLWLPYTVIVHSYAGTLTQIGLAVAILFGMWKHDRVPKTEHIPGT